MKKKPSGKLAINKFSRLILILLGVGIWPGLWVVQQNNVNRLNARIISLKNSIDLAEEDAKKGKARDQSFTVEKKLAMEKDILVIEKDKASIQNGVYTTLVQALGGIILSVTAYVGYCNYRVGEKNLKITEDKQVTERFSKSIEHLGNDKIDIRLGGIYALEQIAIDSTKYHWTIVEILSAFIREKCSIDCEIAHSINDENKSSDNQFNKRNTVKEVVSLDIQAALSVLNRREIVKEDKVIDLSRVNLKKADLSNANLDKANLSGANLKEANLREANLFGANLSGADLRTANLSGANLKEANLREANLFGANLSEANLSNACLFEAILIGTNLSGANLSNARLFRAKLFETDLHGVNLRKADLSNADLRKANLFGTDLHGVNLREADLNEAYLGGVDLSSTDNLSKEQIDSAITDKNTKLPDNLKPKSQT
jgi:uncharacterized protein YjbI with pentapeptide repeats